MTMTTPSPLLSNATPDLPSRLRGWRAANGLSQPKAAALLKVPLGTLRRWEQGTRTPGRGYQMHLDLALREPVEGEAD
jgi:DNA-binding transcriptional regulator YiaG